MSSLSDSQIESLLNSALEAARPIDLQDVHRVSGLVSVAHCFYALGKADKAEELFTMAEADAGKIQDDIDRNKALKHVVTGLTNTGRYEKALELSDRLTEPQKGREKIYLLKEMVSKGKTIDAEKILANIDACLVAEEEGFFRAFVYVDLAEALPEKATEYLASAVGEIEKEPYPYFKAVSFIRIAGHYRAAGETAESTKNLETALDALKNHDDYLRHLPELAIEFVKNGQPDRARELLDEGISGIRSNGISPLNECQITADYAVALWKAGKKEADALLSGMLEKKKGQRNLVFLAQAYAKIGNAGKVAGMLLERSGELTPETKGLLFPVVADFCFEQDEGEKGERLLQAAVESLDFKGDPWFAVNIATKIAWVVLNSNAPA